MKTSWNDTILTEHYLSGSLSDEERALFEARLILEPQLADNLKWQQKTTVAARQYGRQNLREEIEQVSHHIFTASHYVSFRKKVLSFFG